VKALPAPHNTMARTLESHASFPNSDIRPLKTVQRVSSSVCGVSTATYFHTSSLSAFILAGRLSVTTATPSRGVVTQTAAQVVDAVAMVA